MSALQLFDEWSTYEKVVANDYMHHRNFFAVLLAQVASRFDRALSVIDIGCGDAQPVLTLLERLPVERYVGIDQSVAALDRARQALTETGISYDLRNGSMLKELRMLNGEFDLAIGSYSLHHLDREQKYSVLSECRRLLQANGLLAIIDVFLEEGESRSTYIERWQNNARLEFTALAPQELQALLEHMRSSDMPETVSEYRRIGGKAGFETVRPISQDPERLNRLVLCY
jgi:ubiquinone/menaquinone biosynthesis C-methylase UbiE